MPNIHNRKILEPFRKNLRNHSTAAEATLWNYLKGKQLGYKFRRQHSIGNYIVDFYCAPYRVAIELDGKKHFTKEGIQYDNKRTEYLKTLNVTVIRFENVRVFEDVESVLNEIRAVLTTLTHDRRSESVPPEAGGTVSATSSRETGG